MHLQHLQNRNHEACSWLAGGVDTPASSFGFLYSRCSLGTGLLARDNQHPWLCLDKVWQLAAACVASCTLPQVTPTSTTFRITDGGASLLTWPPARFTVFDELPARCSIHPAQHLDQIWSLAAVSFSSRSLSQSAQGSHRPRNPDWVPSLLTWQPARFTVFPGFLAQGSLRMGVQLYQVLRFAAAPNSSKAALCVCPRSTLCVYPDWGASFLA